MTGMMDTSLDTLAAAAKTAGRFAFDTEFMGEGRYRTLLCLICSTRSSGISTARR
jgi:ribonuclease D